jgi:hypothetical protein
MTDLSTPQDLPTDWTGQLEAELDDTAFWSVAEGLFVFGPAAEPLTVPRQADRGRPLESAVAEQLESMVRALGEKWIGGWNQREDVPEHTTQYLEAQQAECSRKLVTALRAWADPLDADEQIRMLLHLWWKCFVLCYRSLAYRTIRAVTDAMADFEKSCREDWPRWQQDTWRAVGAALELMKLDHSLYAEISLSCAAKVQRIARDEAIPKATQILDGLDLALSQPEYQPDGAGQHILPCLLYIRAYADQGRTLCKVVGKTAGVMVSFEDWLAGAPDAYRRQRPGAASPALWPLPVGDAPKARVVEALKYLEESKSSLTDVMLSYTEPWEQMLIELRDLMTIDQNRDVALSVLIPRQAWVRYCFPFAVRDDNGRLAEELLRVRPETPQHRLSMRLREELNAKAGLDLMKIGEPTELAQTEFFQVGTGTDGHFGGIRIDLPALMFARDFLDGDGPRRYRAWLDLNRMGNFCLCVEAAEPLKDIPPPRLYRALRAGTPFVFGEPVTLALRDVGGEARRLPEWDSLYMFAQDMIRAAADAYYFPTRREAREASADPAHYVRANLHEVVIVQTHAPISVHSEEIASRLDSAVGGRILLRSVQRAAGTLEEWIRFPPLQRAEQRARASAVVTVPEIGYTGDWFVHTGETTVFGIVAVPAWMRDLYPEAAQFASSWSPLLQLWNRRLQDAVKDLRNKRDAATGAASEELRNIEQQVRLRLAEINAEDLCATLAYRRFLDSLLEAVGIGRLEKQLEAQLTAGQQLTDYFYQREEHLHLQAEKLQQQQKNKAARRRDVLLFFIALFGVFGLSDYLALYDTTNHTWQDVLVLAIFGISAVGGVCVWLGAERLKRLLPKRLAKRQDPEIQGEQKRSVA